MSFRPHTLHAIVLFLVIVTVLLYFFYANIVELIPLKEYSGESKKKIQTTEEFQTLEDKNNTVKISVSEEYSSKSSSPRKDIQHTTSSKATRNFGSRKDATRNLYEGGHTIINSDLCPNFGSNIKIVILITTAPFHFQERNAVRMTWGHYNLRKDIVVAFVVGSTFITDFQTSLVTESEVYGDIIQGNFVDSYNNLTLKTLSMLEWVNTYCYRAHFLLKTDDDMFINVDQLLKFVEHVWNIPRTIYGRLAEKWEPNRNETSKYYIPYEQYYQNVFPNFTTGPAYLITEDCLHDLYQHALQRTFVKLEDVFITGIVSEALNISRVNVKEFHNVRIMFLVCDVKNAISIHYVSYREQFLLWIILFDLNTECYEPKTNNYYESTSYSQTWLE